MQLGNPWAIATQMIEQLPVLRIRAILAQSQDARRARTDVLGYTFEDGQQNQRREHQDDDQW